MPTHPESTLPIGRSGLAALGIVFGDIGTSPLYTLKTVLSMTVGGPTPDVVFGVLSLVDEDWLNGRMLCTSRWSGTPYMSATSSGCLTIASF
jgi:K+ potassium transporter